MPISSTFDHAMTAPTAAKPPPATSAALGEPDWLPIGNGPKRHSDRTAPLVCGREFLEFGDGSRRCRFDARGLRSSADGPSQICTVVRPTTAEKTANMENLPQEPEIGRLTASISGRGSQEPAPENLCRPYNKIKRIKCAVMFEKFHGSVAIRQPLASASVLVNPDRQDTGWPERRRSGARRSGMPRGRIASIKRTPIPCRHRFR